MAGKSISKEGQLSVGVMLTGKNILADPTQFSVYTILVVSEGAGTFKADFGSFPVSGPTIIFATPLQTIQLKGSFNDIAMLQFHGDYYCIEYHKKEVACNGVLFNNIYTDPIISLEPDKLAFFSRVMHDIDAELAAPKPVDAVIISFIQVLLAKATSLKTSPDVHPKRDDKMEMFRQLVDKNFISMRKPADYAKLLHISGDTLTKRSRLYFRKTPSELIQERMILEAKKRLHLSRKSIKEIAYALEFEDEHYFSRFFKKVTKVSPQAFRQETGISIVADLSISKPE